MKILLIHNKYQYKGGEDTVFESEFNMLKNRAEQVEKLVFNNNEINSIVSKIKVGIYSFYNNESAKVLSKKIEEFKPDIIHVHNFFPIASPSIFYVANIKKVPIVMTLHNYRLVCPNAMLFRDNKVCEDCINKSFAFDGVFHGCYRDSKIQTLFLASMIWFHKRNKTWLNRVDRYIALTDFAKNKFLNSSLKLDKSKIVVKPNFVIDNGFELDKEEYCLFVGRLSQEKGIEVMLNAFKNSSKKIQIIGTGPLVDMVKEYSTKYENIEYLGFKSIDFIIQKLKKAKALIFTSILYETFGMTIIEAFSTATPVVCSDIGGPAEIVEDGKTGLKYQVGNSKELQKKVEQLYTDESLHIKLCRGAREEFEKKYTEKINYLYLKKIYESIINEKV